VSGAREKEDVPRRSGTPCSERAVLLCRERREQGKPSRTALSLSLSNSFVIFLI